MNYEDFTTVVSSRRAFESAINFAVALVVMLVLAIAAMVSS